MDDTWVGEELEDAKLWPSISIIMVLMGAAAMMVGRPQNKRNLWLLAFKNVRTDLSLSGMDDLLLERELKDAK